jgi:four helix bundle protein
VLRKLDRFEELIGWLKPENPLCQRVLSQIKRFEDLIPWQKARELTRAIDRVTQARAFTEDLGLARQMQGAAVSIMSNIAEGFERRGRREFQQFLFTAKGSCAEVRSQLYVAFDIGYSAESDFHRLLAQAEEVGRVVGGLRASIERLVSEQRG